MKNPILVFSLVFLLCFTFGCQNKSEKAELEKFRAQVKVEEQNKERFLKVTEEYNKGNFDIRNETDAPDYALFSPATYPKSKSSAEVIAMMKTSRESFPDMSYNIVECVPVGDNVITRYVFRCTHKGTFQGIPATGNKVELSVMNWTYWRDGKIVTEREEFDMLGFMQQLGMELKPKGVKK